MSAARRMVQDPCGHGCRIPRVTDPTLAGRLPGTYGGVSCGQGRTGVCWGRAAAGCSSAPSLPHQSAPARCDSGTRSGTSMRTVVQPTSTRASRHHRPERGRPLHPGLGRHGPRPREGPHGRHHRQGARGVAPCGWLPAVLRQGASGDPGGQGRRGAVISFSGDSTAPYTIEVINVHVAVKKGWYIALKASRWKTIRCTMATIAEPVRVPATARGRLDLVPDGR